MLTPRNVISLVVLIAVVSLTWSIIGLLQPPDSDGLRGDSYGTRHHGQRAVLETLSELGIEVDRQLKPPVPGDLSKSVLVFWNPHQQLVASEPTWLQGLNSAIRSGGHVVIAEDGSRRISEEVREAMEESSSNGLMVANPDQSALELVGVTDVYVTPDESGLAFPTEEASFEELIAGAYTSTGSQARYLRYSVRGTGQFESASDLIETIAVPDGELHEIESASSIESAVFAVDSEGREHCIAARVPLGEGSVTVAPPWLVNNGSIGQSDNVVLAALLLLRQDRGVVFDEFYHGLGVRGNPLWLFSQRTYGTVVLALLALCGIFFWRHAVSLGPPLAVGAMSRRSVREYIGAMARFMLKSRFHDRWLLERVRDGVLWHLRQEHGLPPEQHRVSELLAIMERRDPDRAGKLRSSLDEVDSVISNRVRPGHTTVIRILQRMTSCLSRNSTGQSVTKSAK